MAVVSQPHFPDACRALGERSEHIARAKRTELRRVGWEFFCKVCANEFEADWTEGEPVACPRCAAVFETAWQFNVRGELVGPWLSKRVPRK